jgi:hypothetical protein
MEALSRWFSLMTASPVKTGEVKLASLRPEGYDSPVASKELDALLSVRLPKIRRLFM